MADAWYQKLLDMEAKLAAIQTAVSSGGTSGTQYTDGAAAPAHPVGNQIMFNNAGTETAVSAANPFPTSATVTPAANQRVNAQANDFLTGSIVDLLTLLNLAGTAGDANTVASLMGRLTKIRDLLAATLTVQGTITEANSATAVTRLTSILSALSLLQVEQADLSTSGTINAAQPAINTPVAGASVQLTVGQGQSTWKALLTDGGGGFTGATTIVADKSVDNAVTWTSASFKVTGASPATTQTTVVGPGPLELTGVAAGVTHVRIRCSVRGGTETIAVVLRAGAGVADVGIISSIPAGANEIGAMLLRVATGVALAADQSNTILRNSMYGKSSGGTAGDTPFLLDAQGRILSKLGNGTQDIDTFAGDSGNNGLIVGSGVKTTGAIALSAGTLATQWFDMANWPWLAVEVAANASANSLVFQTSNDPSQTIPSSMPLIPAGNTAGGPNTSTTTTGNWHGPRAARYFRILSTLSGGNTATVYITFFSSATQMPSLTAGVNGVNIWGTPSDAFAQQTATGYLGAFEGRFNGTTWDRVRNNQDGLSIINAVATSSTQTSADILNYNGRGVKVWWNITTFGAALTLAIQYKDPVSGQYITALSSAALSANGFTQYTIYPGITGAANVALNDILPRTWRVQVTGASGSTFTVGASVIV